MQIFRSFPVRANATSRFLTSRSKFEMAVKKTGKKSKVLVLFKTSPLSKITVFIYTVSIYILAVLVSLSVIV